MDLGIYFQKYTEIIASDITNPERPPTATCEPTIWKKHNTTNIVNTQRKFLFGGIIKNKADKYKPVPIDQPVLKPEKPDIARSTLPNAEGDVKLGTPRAALAVTNEHNTEIKSAEKNSGLLNDIFAADSAKAAKNVE